MKKWLLYAAVVILVAVLGYRPFSGSDVAVLQPVELIYVEIVGDSIVAKTDTGDMGKGKTVEQTLADLKGTTTGEVFLDTADYLLVRTEAVYLLQELTQILRPACCVCAVQEEVDLMKAAEYLRTRNACITLQQYRAGEGSVPFLIVDEERFRLVCEES